MATADLKLVYGGGGSFKPSFFSGRLQIASASSGTLLTLTPPAGKKVRLTGLIVTPTGSEANISITADGNAVITNLTLSVGTNGAAGNFSVGSPWVSSTGQGAGDIPYIDGISSIVIQKTTGSTAAAIAYSYAYGE